MMIDEHAPEEGITHSYRWRICLSMAGLILALGLSMVDVRQEGRRNGHSITPALAVSYSLNFPSWAFSEQLWMYVFRPLGLDTVVHPYGHIEYYSAVSAFWWIVGKKLDTKQRVRPDRRCWLTAWYGTGVFFSLSLLLIAVLNWNTWGDTNGVSVAGILWGLTLTCYCIVKLLSYWGTSGR